MRTYVNKIAFVFLTATLTGCYMNTKNNTIDRFRNKKNSISQDSSNGRFRYKQNSFFHDSSNEDPGSSVNYNNSFASLMNMPRGIDVLFKFYADKYDIIEVVEHGDGLSIDVTPRRDRPGTNFACINIHRPNPPGAGYSDCGYYSNTMDNMKPDYLKEYTGNLPLEKIELRRRNREKEGERRIYVEVGDRINRQLTNEFNDSKNDLTAFMGFLSKIKSSSLKENPLLKNKLAELHQKNGGYDGYSNSYKLTGNVDDLKKSYTLASSMKEKKEAEERLISVSNLDLMFVVDILNASDGPIKEGVDSSLGASVKGGFRSMKRSVKIHPNKNAPMQLRYGELKLKVEFTLDLDFDPPINGKGKDLVVKQVEFNLNPANNWTHQDTVDFGAIPIHGVYHFAAATVLANMANWFDGGSRKASDLDVPFTLKGKEIRYKIIGEK